MAKMTKKEMFGMVMAVVEECSAPNKVEMINFINHELELLNRKSSKSGQTKTQKENESIKEVILEEVAKIGKPVTISEFCEYSNSEVASLTNQKLSALFNQLVKAERMVKTVEKKKSYFSVV